MNIQNFNPKAQTFKKLFTSSDLKVREIDKDPKHYGITVYPYKDTTYYLFEGTPAMLAELPFAM